MNLIMAIKDERTEFNAPFTSKTVQEAERQFATIVKDKDTLVGQFPEDYSLWHLGNYDTMKGTIIPCEPELLIRAKELVKNEI